MLKPNQEVSFEVAEKNQTVTVAVQPPALDEPLPPLTPEQRELLRQTHPSIQAQIERSMHLPSSDAPSPSRRPLAKRS